MHIGMKIKQLRKENKDTLKSLAEKIDYDWSNLSKIERGLYGLTSELLQRIIKVYDVDPRYFLGDNYADTKLLPLDKKYKFIIDGVEATEKEIIEAIRLIRYFRSDKD